LLENGANIGSDGVDFDSVMEGSSIRWTTIRRSMMNNADAIDLGPVNNVSSIRPLVENCLLHDYMDKGISVGDGDVGAGATVELRVRNCLIYNVGRGIEIKDASSATISNCTIADSNVGFLGRTSEGGGAGIFSNVYNVILSNLIIPVFQATNTFFDINYSNIEGVDWPGTSNRNVDPLFLDPADHDYRLSPTSPLRGAGMGGQDMGVIWPVGGIPSTQERLTAAASSHMMTLTWLDDADNEDGFIIERSTNRIDWHWLAMVPTNSTMHIDTNLTPGRVYYYRARSTNGCGVSAWSEVFRGVTTGDGGDDDMDGMPNSWELFHGFDPNESADASMDRDGDGLSNLEEFTDDSNPLDGTCFIRLRMFSLSPSVQRLTFPTRSGRVYAVEETTDLVGGVWSNARTNIIGTGGTFMQPLTNLEDRVYYRLRIE
ncbi:MAG: right-handed parallel beta-helix repeat-containing protein, partial [Verrucomicrobiota bacterium]